MLRIKMRICCRVMGNKKVEQYFFQLRESRERPLQTQQHYKVSMAYPARVWKQQEYLSPKETTQLLSEGKCWQKRVWAGLQYDLTMLKNLDVACACSQIETIVLSTSSLSSQCVWCILTVGTAQENINRILGKGSQQNGAILSIVKSCCLLWHFWRGAGNCQRLKPSRR